jgi:hypothetical protein
MFITCFHCNTQASSQTNHGKSFLSLFHLKFMRRPTKSHKEKYHKIKKQNPFEEWKLKAKKMSKGTLFLENIE